MDGAGWLSMKSATASGSTRLSLDSQSTARRWRGLLVGPPRSDQVRVTLMEYVSEAAERATPLKCDPQFGLGRRVADLVGEIGHEPAPVS